MPQIDRVVVRSSLFVVALGVSALAGCASTPSEKPAEPAAGSSNQLSNAADAHRSPTFRGEPSESAPEGDSSAVLVSLYGETAPGAVPAAGAAGDSNLKQISFAAEGGDFTPDIDHTGHFLVYASKQHAHSFDLYRKAVDGRTVTQLTSDAADDMMPSISPDGSKIAFVSNRNGNWDVFIMPVDGGPPTQMTFERDDEVQPTWSPDGKTVAFARKNGRTSRWEIWTADATQPTGATYLCDGFLPRWCPDQSQNKILFQRARQQGSRLYGVWTIDLVDGQAMNPTEIVSAQNAAVIQPAWSPDGKRLVFTTVVEPSTIGSDMPAQSDLWVVNIDGTGRTAITNGHFRNMQPVWGPNDHIYFVSNRGGLENLWSVSPTVPTAPATLAEPSTVAGAAEGASAETEAAAAEH